MITAYHKPATLDEALTLIRRASPRTVPLGGGTLLSHGQADSIEVVDLQALGLSQIKVKGNHLHLGATVTLQQLLESEHCPMAMKPALKLEAPLNMRNGATIAGTIAVCEGRSTFTTVLMAADAKLSILNSASSTIHLGDFLPLRPQNLQGMLIVGVEIPLLSRLAFDYVSRTPADKPIVAVALAQWPSGRTRLAVCGYGSAPVLAMDGPETDGLETAARNAFYDASDPWGSAEYRMDVAATLARRCLASLQS